jgi:deoxyribonuclease (pyrimidine dimer)
MVRINLINPKLLSDQHLVAEYNEILMLLGHVRKHPRIVSQPSSFCLGRGHINFFKNKLLYLKERHERLKVEMINRGFKPEKSIDLGGFDNNLLNSWSPKEEDFLVIKKRILGKIRSKQDFYKYYGENKPLVFFEGLF